MTSPALPAQPSPPYLIVHPDRPLCRAIGLIGLVDHNLESRSVRVNYQVRPEFCHSNGTTAQGGFVTAWLDHSMACAVVHDSGGALNVASLEIKVSFLEAVRPGTVTTEARVLRRGKRVAFLEGRLLDPNGKLLATASSSGLLVPYTP